MKLYNTLGRTIQELKPLKKGEVRLYTCGPTVYDRAQIGNLRSFIFADTLHRVLRAEGNKVDHVMNTTDIDDKTIRRSQEKYPKLEAHEALKKLTRECEQSFLKDIAAIGINPGIYRIVPATSYIKQMQELIEQIYKAGFAYIAEDGVYFSILNYQKEGGYNYGTLVNDALEHIASHRINNDEYDKEQASDFALWKTAKAGEPSWEFKIGGKNLTGRPGWHIECSAISVTELGQPFDIHTGGIDLVFPHHTNEIAQSKAATGKELSTLFVHNEHLLIDGKRMGKSLKNFYTLEDLQKKGVDPLAFRLLMLFAHYRTQQNFTWESLQSSQNRLATLRAWADMKWQLRQKLGEREENLMKSAISEMLKALSDDLDTPRALAILSDVISLVPPTQEYLEFLDVVFGLELSNRSDITKKQKELIAKREKARADKDFKESDKLRDQLLEDGIELNDTPNGTRWSRTQ